MKIFSKILNAVGIKLNSDSDADSTRSRLIESEDEIESINDDVKSDDIIYFQSTRDAFLYACKYIALDVEPEVPVLGLVLASENGTFSVKLAVRDDCDIPEGEKLDLLFDSNVKNVCFQARPIEKCKPIKVGDLVLVVITAPIYISFQRTRRYALGIIVARCLPQVNVEGNGVIVDG